MIVRLSGSESHRIVKLLLPSDAVTSPGSVTRHSIVCDGMVIPAWVYSACKPSSATGEDSIELHLPGNPILVQIVLARLCTAGARLAEPGEFSARAFFNGRLDLAAAEGIAAVIAANNDQEFMAARQLMAGELARQLRPILDELSETLALLETGIDFAEEEITVLERPDLLRRVAGISDRLQRLRCDSGRLATGTAIPTVVLAGYPNAGKSSLLNAVAGKQRAVIAPSAGTTRDALSMEVRLKRGFIRLVDLPGIETPGDEISTAMQEYTRRAITTADVIVLVHHSGDSRPVPALPVAPHLNIRSKSDLCKSEAGMQAVSVKTGDGLEEFRSLLDEAAFRRPGKMLLMLNERHVQAMDGAREILVQLLASGARGAEIDAALLRSALDSLGTILGEVTPDDIIGKIFSTFCIGK